ncbi:MAG TPA: cytochrome c oxidase assembly protein [Gemmatimonadaceae bacterium]|jgi:cytochrome c oxidase assembly factor CtaG
MIAALLGVVCVAYSIGVRAAWTRAGRGRGIRLRQLACFALGMATLFIALLSPIDTQADELFSAHMIQHVLLTIVAPPFLVSGAPIVALLFALPLESRRRTVRAIKRSPALTTSWETLTSPAIACGVHAVALWTWHIPRLYSLALEHPTMHALEHASFIGTAALLWWSIIHPRRSRRAAYGIGIATLFATMLQSGVLGALLTLSHRVWYPLQTIGAATHGLSPLEDQQLAGLIMWVPGGLLYLIGMAALFLGFIREVGSSQREIVAATAG